MTVSVSLANNVHSSSTNDSLIVTALSASNTAPPTDSPSTAAPINNDFFQLPYHRFANPIVMFQKKPTLFESRIHSMCTARSERWPLTGKADFEARNLVVRLYNQLELLGLPNWAEVCYISGTLGLTSQHKDRERKTDVQQRILHSCACMALSRAFRPRTSISFNFAWCSSTAHTMAIHQVGQCHRGYQTALMASISTAYESRLEEDALQPRTGIHSCLCPKR